MDLLKKLYEDQILPNLRWHEALSNFNPSDKGSYFNINCPTCGQHEAVIYKNSGAVKCNRQNKCKYEGNLLGLMNGGDQPMASKFVDIIKRLCDLSGVAFPEKTYTTEQIDKFKERDRQQELFKHFMTICVSALYESNKGISYLATRGLTIEKLKRRNDIGFYPDQAFIKQELEKKGYLPTEIYDSGLIRSDWDGRIIFSIEERGKIGDFIAGYITPTVQSEKKYLRMNGAKAYDKSALLGLHKAEKDIFLVEGVFDYLTLDDAGIKNVVALGGSNLWDEHIPKLISHKVKTITLLLDNDDAGVKGTISIIEKLIDADIEVYVADHKALGESKDSDQFIRDHGISAINQILNECKHGFEYIAHHLLSKHKINDTWTTRAKYNLLDDANKFLSNISNPRREIAKDKFWKLIIAETDIDEDIVTQYEKEAAAKKREKAKKEILDKFQKEFYSAQASGNYSAAENVLFKISEELGAINGDQNDDFQLQFINDMPKNYLLVEAPPMPSLISINLKGFRTPFIPRGIVASVVGAGGIGKTHWLTQLALSIATNTPFLGAYQVTQQGSVALVLGENSDEDMHRLLQKTTKGFFGELRSNDAMQKIQSASSRLAPMSVTGKNASFLNYHGEPSTFYVQLRNELISKEPVEGWSLIILDPASRFLGADAETDNAKATAFIALLEDLICVLKGKPTILFGHHMNKQSRGQVNTGADASRGSSGLTDGVRLQINLEPVENEPQSITMRVTKSNHTAYPPAQKLHKGDYGHLQFLKDEIDYLPAQSQAKNQNVSKKSPDRVNNKTESSNSSREEQVIMRFADVNKKKAATKG